MVNIRYIIFFILMLVIISGCKDIVDNSNKELLCSSNSECVPEQCCHATSCVNSQYKSDCSGIMCTMDCRPGTMDCVQGDCICENNKCSAKIRAGDTQIANPASVFCVNNGGTLEIRTNPDGGQYGVCIFPNGIECEEWKYFRGEC